MSDNTVVLNGNAAPFVDDEFDAGNGNIEPGMVLEFDANDDVIPHSTDPSTDTEAVGQGMFAELNEFDPSQTKSDTYPSGERVKVVYCPVGGKVDALLAAGSDLTDSARANVGPQDVLEEIDNGTLAEHDGSDTTGDGTGAATETVFDTGALYVPLESVDNSGAASAATSRIEVVRIA